MPFLIGIDLGTQSVKSLVLDGEGGVRAVAQAEYPILTPRLAPSPGDPTEPIPRNIERYRGLHALYRSLYPRLKEAYRELSS